MRHGCASDDSRSTCLCIPQHLEPLSDNPVMRIQLVRPRIRVNRVRDLVVTALVQRPQVEPDLRDIRIDPDSARVRIERVPILVDLEVQHANRAPERWVTPIAVNSLLISLVRLVILLSRHIRPTKKVPALRVRWVRLKALGEVRDSEVLGLESAAVLMIQPSKLLKDLGVGWVFLHDALISILSARMVLHLLVYVSNLEPNIGVGERVRRIAEYAIEALERLGVLGLLLVNDAQTEENLVCLVKFDDYEKSKRYSK